MKLSKKLLAGLLATSMLATGSTAFAAIKLDDGTKGTLAETKPGSGIYKGSGKMTMDAVGDPAQHAVTGTATFTDDISVEITWGALTYSFTRTWNTGTSDWNKAVWETTTGSGKISATNKSAQDYSVVLSFAHTDFNGDHKDNTVVDYSSVDGVFLKNEALNADEAKTKTDYPDDVSVTNEEQKILKLTGKGGTGESYLWLTGDPVNDASKSVVGKYGFNAEGTTATNSEVFGTVTATLGDKDGKIPGQGGI